MKQYGYMKATEFTKKQINVIFAKAKHGELKVEKWFVSELYALADFYDYDDNGSVGESEAQVIRIIEAVFANESEKAQELIDYTSNRWFALMSKKNQAKCNRNIFVA